MSPERRKPAHHSPGGASPIQRPERFETGGVTSELDLHWHWFQRLPVIGIGFLTIRSRNRCGTAGPRREIDVDALTRIQPTDVAGSVEEVDP